jgi:GNAT superfamily N-acetyltransferase
MRSIDSKSAFLLIKQFDGMPRLNGTPMIACKRAYHFWDIYKNRQNYYESVGTPAELVRQRLFVSDLERIGLPRHMQDGHLLAFEIFESSSDAPGGRLQLPRPGDSSRGLHAVDITGCSPDGSVIHFWNNWGPGWGDHGYGSMSIEYLNAHFHEAWTTRRARWGPSPEKLGRLPPVFDREFRRVWEIENPRLRWKVQSSTERRPRVVFYQTVSPSSGEPVECIEIRNGFGLRMAWAFLRHRTVGQRATTEITELFVWPIFRRVKFGSFLEAWAVDRANEWGSTELHLWMNADDAIVGPPSPRTAARRFGSARGYIWRWVNTTTPRVAAIGVKSL